MVYSLGPMKRLSIMRNQERLLFSSWIACQDFDALRPGDLQNFHDDVDRFFGSSVSFGTDGGGILPMRAPATRMARKDIDKLQARLIDVFDSSLPGKPTSTVRSGSLQFSVTTGKDATFMCVGGDPVEVFAFVTIALLAMRRLVGLHLNLCRECGAAFVRKSSLQFCSQIHLNASASRRRMARQKKERETRIPRRRGRPPGSKNKKKKAMT